MMKKICHEEMIKMKHDQNTDEHVDKYSGEYRDISEANLADFKINVDYLMFRQIIKCQDALADRGTPLAERITNYRNNVELLKVMARSSGMYPRNFDEEMSKMKESEEYKKKKEIHQRFMLIANKTMELILEEVLSRRDLTNPMQM